LTRALLDSGATAIAYETVRTEDGRLPLLTPMSEVAGKMAAQEAAKYLERSTQIATELFFVFEGVKRLVLSEG